MRPVRLVKAAGTAKASDRRCAIPPLGADLSIACLSSAMGCKPLLDCLFLCHLIRNKKMARIIAMPATPPTTPPTTIGVAGASSESGFCAFPVALEVLLEVLLLVDPVAPVVPPKPPRVVLEDGFSKEKVTDDEVDKKIGREVEDEVNDEEDKVVGLSELVTEMLELWEAVAVDDREVEELLIVDDEDSKNIEELPELEVGDANGTSQ